MACPLLTADASTARFAAPAAAAAEAPAARKYHPSPLSQAAPATYAIIEVGGHQMFVEPGKWYTCNRLQVRIPQATSSAAAVLLFLQC